MATDLNVGDGAPPATNTDSTSQPDVLQPHADGLGHEHVLVVMALENAQLHQRLQQVVRTRDEFLSAAAHDLKTPLATMKGIAQLLDGRVRRLGLTDQARLTDGLERIDATASRMAAMIDELLDLTRSEMDSPIELERQYTDLVVLVRQATAHHQFNAPRHRFTVEIEQPEYVGHWDPIRIRRVVDNLLSNSIKHSPAGGEVSIRLALRVHANRRFAVLRIVDQGMGIPPADLPYIFERFRRGGNVGVVQGTGIGLAGTRMIVEQHGGTITVQSAEGQGSTFTVHLPLE